MITANASSNRRIVIAVVALLALAMSGGVILQRRLAARRAVERVAQRREVLLERIRTNRMLAEAAYARCQVHAALVAEHDAGASPSCVKADLPSRFWETLQESEATRVDRAETAIAEANTILDVADAEARAHTQ